MNDFFNILLATIIYITEAPYFWVTMGSISAVSIFVGAILYDGILPVAFKGTIAIILYASLIFATHMIRASNSINIKQLTVSEMSYASPIALVIITIFWVAGVMLGVYTSHRVRVKHQFDKKK